jgi:ABC-type multidrug transport system fused ATPase/permease subunit
MRVREAYFKAVLRQQIVWFDRRQSGEMASRLNEYVCVPHARARIRSQ